MAFKVIPHMLITGPRRLVAICLLEKVEFIHWALVLLPATRQAFILAW